jgi:PKHD-type hydroxylase
MIGESRSVRKDYSFTLMLSTLEEYDGGELEIEDNGMKHKVKLDAGDMVIYPSTLIHKVLPVITGERLADGGWIASHVKDPLALEILNAYEDMHLSLQQYELSSDDRLTLSYVQNKLQHLLSD